MIERDFDHVLSSSPLLLDNEFQRLELHIAPSGYVEVEADFGQF